VSATSHVGLASTDENPRIDSAASDSLGARGDANNLSLFHIPLGI